MRRRSVSSCVSPGPRTPIPPRNFSRWAHIRVSRGNMYCSCASSTCIFASLDLARVAKMSRISSARSITRCPVASSIFFPCDGESSSSNTISDAFLSWMARRSSSTLPFPRYVAGFGLSICCVTSPTTTPPAVSTSRSSSSKCSATVCLAFDPLRGAPTSTTLSTGAVSSISSLEIYFPSCLPAHAAECGESSGTLVGPCEVTQWRRHRHVPTHRIRHRAALDHLPGGATDAGVGEVDRNTNLRRVAFLHRETRIERAASNPRALTNDQVVGQTRRVEPESVRVVNTEVDIHGATAQSKTANAHVLEVDDRLLKYSAPERRAGRYRKNSHGQPDYPCPSHLTPPRQLILPPDGYSPPLCCPPGVTVVRTLSPSGPPTRPDVLPLPSRIRRVQARRRRSHAIPRAGTLAGCMPPGPSGRTGTPHGTPAPSSGSSGRS